MQQQLSNHIGNQTAVAPAIANQRSSGRARDIVNDPIEEVIDGMETAPLIPEPRPDHRCLRTPPGLKCPSKEGSQAALNL